MKTILKMVIESFIKSYLVSLGDSKWKLPVEVALKYLQGKGGIYELPDWTKEDLVKGFIRSHHQMRGNLRGNGDYSSYYKAPALIQKVTHCNHSGPLYTTVGTYQWEYTVMNGREVLIFSDVYDWHHGQGYRVNIPCDIIPKQYHKPLLTLFPYVEIKEDCFNFYEGYLEEWGVPLTCKKVISIEEVKELSYSMEAMYHFNKWYEQVK